MNATGIVRRVDDLGRVVIPKDIRRYLGIQEGDPLEIYVEGNSVIYQKYAPRMMEQYTTVLSKVLKSKGITFAIYNNYDMITTNASKYFPHSVPDAWYHLKNDTENVAVADKEIFTIEADRIIMGFVAIRNNKENDEYVKAIIDTINAEMEEGI